MGRLGLIMVAILGAFFAFQTMDAAFNYDEADAKARAEYLARAGNRLSHSAGFQSSMFAKTEEVTAFVPARKVVIRVRQPDGFVLNSATRSAEMQRKCANYGKSTLAENNVQARINYSTRKGRRLGSITLSPSICRRYIERTRVAHR